MIKILKGNVNSKVESFDSEAEEKAFKKAMTVEIPGAWFSQAYKSHSWDGTYCFYSGYSKTFPTGLLTILPENLASRLVVNDGRKKPNVEIGDTELSNFDLRDYQLEAIRKALELGRCIITAPTNAGKTILGAGLIKAIPGRTLWLTHRGNLMYQTKEKFEQALAGEEVGIIHRDIADIKRITIAMVPTLTNRLFSDNEDVKKMFRNWLVNEVDMLIIDEAHHTAASTFYKICKLCNAYWRFGLSATPLMRSDIQNLRLVAMTGEEVKTVTNQELIARGISAAPTIYRVKNTVAKFVGSRNWQDSYVNGIEANVERNNAIARIVTAHMARREPVMILINTIAHAENLLHRLSPGVKFVQGETESFERNRILKQLSSGEIPAVIATPLFDEGVDLPDIRVLVLGGGGKSHLRLLQRLGRGMRKKPGLDNTVKVYDFADTGDYYLSQHSAHRLKLYRSEGFDVIPYDIPKGD